MCQGCLCTQADPVYSPKWPSNTQRSILISSIALLIIVYLVCLVIAVHNVYKYLIKAKRWRSFLLSSFYFIVIMLVSTRITSLLYFEVFFSERNDC